MPLSTSTLLVMLMLMAISGSAVAQHCGGPCEVPRGAEPVSPNPKYTLSQGIEANNWRYLHNWFWTEDGVQKHRVEEALRSLPARDFGYRRMFVSPSGNGFLVTGNAYANDHLQEKKPPLFVFYDPEGRRLSQLSLFDASEPKSRRRGPCPACDCQNVLYVFAEEPALSDNGVFVELCPYRGSTLSFFLPFGCPVVDRRGFEKALEKAEWARLTKDEAERAKLSIDQAIAALNSDDSLVRSEAAESLLKKGFLVLTAISQAQYNAKTGNLRARAKAVESKLRPLGGLPYETMSTDLSFLSSMLSYEEFDVVQSIQAQLQRILPNLEEVSISDYNAWIDEHKRSLKWNEQLGRYE